MDLGCDMDLPLAESEKMIVGHDVDRSCCDNPLGTAAAEKKEGWRGMSRVKGVATLNSILILSTQQ